MISVFIPVRKGSKRVKNKNIRAIGKYKLGLLEIKLKQLEKLIKINNNKYNFEFIVSTDSKIVEEYCKKFNWIKVHKRNKKLSGDHSLQKLINIVPKICNGNFILWTHVTSPLFTSKNYMSFLNIFFKKRKLKLVSAFSADQIKKFVYSTEQGWVSHNTNKIRWPRSQDLKNLYILNSAALIADKKTFIKDKDRISKNSLPIISRKISGFDIDTMEDFKKLNYLKIKF
jgi:N-acylneuraminate cytidylyltransferase